MKVDYTNRAIADLRKISNDSRREFGERVAEELEARIRSVVDRISNSPLTTRQQPVRHGDKRRLHIVVSRTFALEDAATAGSVVLVV